jgi:hypothetical protein
MFHLVKRAIDVARLKFNSAAAIDDDVRVQSEVASIQRVVLSEAHSTRFARSG